MARIGADSDSDGSRKSRDIADGCKLVKDPDVPDEAKQAIVEELNDRYGLKLGLKVEGKRSRGQRSQGCNPAQNAGAIMNVKAISRQLSHLDVKYRSCDVFSSSVLFRWRLIPPMPKPSD